MSIRNAPEPPKEFLQEIVRDDHSQDGRQRDRRAADSSPSHLSASASGIPAARGDTALLPNSVQAWIDTPILFHLHGGTQLQGVLVAVWRYEFLVRRGGGVGAFVIVMKHSVDWLEPARSEAGPVEGT